MAAYTYLDEVYTEYTEKHHQRDGVQLQPRRKQDSRDLANELTARLGYDELSRTVAGLGGFVEVQWKNSFYMDNANLLKAPGYELVNFNVHYKTDLTSDYSRR